MAQHDYTIDNQSFPATRTDINNVLLAISSTNSGATAPSTSYPSQLWYDTTNNKLYIRNEDNDAWIPLFLLDQSNDVAGTLATEIDVEDASGTDTAGTALTIKGGAGTGTGAGGSIIFQTADGAGSTGSSVNAHATQVTITDDGKVGIGTSSPSSILHLSAPNDPIITLTDTNHGGSADITGSNGNLRLNSGTATLFDIADSEIARFDDSGNLLVGTTTTTPASTTGVAISGNNGYVYATRDGNASGIFNRLTSDGKIISLRKDGTEHGEIGVTGSYPFFAGAGAGLMPRASDIVPTNGSGALSDNTEDLGDGVVRFDDVFATNGTIQTSDQNEKQQISSLTNAEITAAKAISKLFKTFKWNDKVEAKGDAARTHTGVVAQEVQSAMTDAGLDATKYAFWCSDTWWETQTEVPAVEAVAEVLDDDGNVVTEAVEAQDAYTRTDTYETAEEAPEGATERTRLGIRYPELLAFIGAATEQRLADIETRLTALEG